MLKIALQDFLLLSLLVNNISEALNFGNIVSYIDDSKQTFQGDSLEDVCKTWSNVVTWLQDSDRQGSQQSKKSSYFLQDQFDLKIKIGSIVINVGKQLELLAQYI